MKTACVMTCAVVLLVGVGFTSCSAGTGTAPSYSSETNRIQRLEQIFDSPQSSDLERLSAASELVRLGVRNPKYWLHVQSEARTALDREKVAARNWKKQRTVEYASSVERRIADRDRVADTSLSLAGSSSNPKAPIVSSTKVTGYTTNLSVDERKPDGDNLPAIMALAASKHPDSLYTLRRALEGDNALIVAEAALGLANLKDHESIPKIVEAANRFDEDFLFAQALVYFGTTNADSEADRLLRDKPKLLHELKATAKAHGYEPYGAK
ncbi:MAG: HEAT repeat domain-containing protein [Thermoanaerobaculia bacterium]